MKKIVGLLMLGVVSISSAQALDVSVVGGLTAGKPSMKPDLGNNFKGGTALTYGALLGFSPGILFGFETGILSVGKKSKLTVLGVEKESSRRAWEIPLLLRFNALPLVSFGAGVFVQQGAGDITNKVGSAETKESYDSAGMKKTDFGVKLNARAGMPIAPLTSIIIDASFKRGFTNLDKNPVGDASLKTSEFDLLAGVNFGF